MVSRVVSKVYINKWINAWLWLTMCTSHVCLGFTKEILPECLHMLRNPDRLAALVVVPVAEILSLL